MSTAPSPAAADFDLLILGGGSAGYAAARTGHDLGLRVAVVDGADELGGLCILRGCMPSKTLIASSERARAIRHAADLALRARFDGVEAPALRQRKRRLVAEFAGYRSGQLQDGRFTLIRGHGRLLGDSRVWVSLRNGGERMIRAGAILLATGSVLDLPDIPGLRESRPWTSDEVLEADRIPASVIVLGGGAIGCELASFYEGIGSRVTQLQRGEQLLRESDADVAAALAAGMRAHGIELVTRTRLVAIRRLPDGRIEVDYDHAGRRHTAHADELVCALGRRPAVDGLDLAAAGIATDGDGRPRVDRTQRCQAPAPVFAAGDLAGPWEIVHVAIQQGEIAARNAARALGRLDGPAERRDDHALLFGVFSSPEVAQVGLTEKRAAAQGLRVLGATYPFDDHGKSLVLGETHGFVKLLADPGDGRVLGAACVGPHANELIHGPALAVHLGLDVRRYAAMPFYHPTLHEIWSYPAEELAERIP